MVELKTSAEIDAMAAAGAVVAEALTAVIEHASPGRSTAELDRVAADVLACLNDAVVHSIPNGQVLADGDLVAVDFGATLRGWCGDAARSFIVGTPRAQDAALIGATEAALAAGIARQHAG